MKNNKFKPNRKSLRQTINNSFIYKQKTLSHHTKCILSKMLTDIICGHEEPTFNYVCINIFNIWPEGIVWNAIEELAEADIMYVDFSDDEDEMEDDSDDMLIFNTDFLDRICPSLGHCQCCNPAPTNFNVNYN